MIIRMENPGDEQAIHLINDAAFHGGPEADLVDRLRQSDAVILSLVAEQDRHLVGCILFTEATIGDVQVAALAPLAVLPEYQHHGIGRTLINDGLNELFLKRYPAVIMVGDPRYYSRFGFRPADYWNINCEYKDVPAGSFMALVWDDSQFGNKKTACFHPEFQAAL